MSDDVDPVVVTMQFEASDPDTLLGVLSKYVVLARMEPGCRNVDLVAAVARPSSYLVIEKWESAAAQRTHFDGSAMVEMARSCSGLLASAPMIELWDGISAHDIA